LLKGPIKSKDTWEKARRVRLLILDVDGVLTDGRIVIDDQGTESKFFNVKDGHGMRLIMRAGIPIVFLSGRTSEASQRLAHELGASKVYQNIHNKIDAYEEILEQNGLQDCDVGYVGDDVVDLPILRRVGFSAVVADATEEIKSVADYITEKEGGKGAVREIIELVLRSQEKWEGVTARYHR
jgi:3-deoxy-D-manno-octulosonate 8-phosphate phosphatase (KDO 8-P phosphatase)